MKTKRCPSCDGCGERQPNVQCKKCEGTGEVSCEIDNPDKEHFDKMLLNEIGWKLDREIWAHVPNPDPSEPWTQSKAREESLSLIAEYIGNYDKVKNENEELREQVAYYKQFAPGHAKKATES